MHKNKQFNWSEVQVEAYGGCLYFDDRLVIPARRCYTGYMKLTQASLRLKRQATLYIWWPKIYREIQVHGESYIECVKSGKKLKPLTRHDKLGKLPTVVEPNQEIELDFAGPLSLIWGTKKTHTRMH